MTIGSQTINSAPTEIYLQWAAKIHESVVSLEPLADKLRGSNGTFIEKDVAYVRSDIADFCVKLSGLPTKPGWYWFDGYVPDDMPHEFGGWGRERIRVCCEVWATADNALLVNMGGKYCDLDKDADRLQGDWWTALPPWEMRKPISIGNNGTGGKDYD